MSDKKYKVQFKNWKTGNWVKGKEYDDRESLCKEFDMTKPTMNKILKQQKGIYSKFIKISDK